MHLTHFSEIFVRHRFALLMLVIALSVAAAVGVGRLGFDDMPLNVFKTEKADFEQLQQVFADFGSDDTSCVLVVESPELFSPAAVTQFRELIAALRKLPGVETVQSMDDVLVVDAGSPPRSLLPPADAPLADFERARQQALEHPMLLGQAIAPSGETALIVVRLAGGSQPIRVMGPVIADIKRTIAEIVPDDGLLRVRVTGVPAIRTEIFDSVRRDSKLFAIVGASLAAIMATILFRYPGAVIGVAVPPVLAAFWVMGALGLLGQPITVITTILPTLVMIIAFTDAVHLMFDIRHSITQGVPPLEASRLAIRHLGIACLLTSFTTAVGFASLSLTSVRVIRDFGMVCAMGAGLAFIAVIIMTPLLASSPLSRWIGRDRPGLLNLSHGLGLRVIDWVLAHPRFVTFCGVTLTIVCGLLALRLEPSNRLTESIPRYNESFQALQHCDEEFGGMLQAYLLVQWDEGLSLDSPQVLEGIVAAQEIVQQQPETRYPLSVINILQSLPGSDDDDLLGRVPLLPLVPQDVLNRYVRPDLRQALITMHLPDVGTTYHELAFSGIEQGLAQLDHPGLTFTVTGTVVVASRNINQMISDLATSLMMASVVIFITMVVVFRCWRLGLISILPNVFPLLITAAMLVISGRPLQLTSVIVFSICLGIAVDDTIHFINRFQRELSVDGNVRAAIRRSYIAVGSALVMTTVVLLTGFSTVFLSEMPTSQLFAWLGCTAIFAAVIGDLIVLPALLVLFVKDSSQVTTMPLEPEEEAENDSPPEDAALISQN